jgi:hypothetical protein
MKYVRYLQYSILPYTYSIQYTLYRCIPPHAGSAHRGAFRGALAVYYCSCSPLCWPVLTRTHTVLPLQVRSSVTHDHVTRRSNDAMLPRAGGIDQRLRKDQTRPAPAIRHLLSIRSHHCISHLPIRVYSFSEFPIQTSPSIHTDICGL